MPTQATRFLRPVTIRIYPNIYGRQRQLSFFNFPFLKEKERRWRDMRRTREGEQESRRVKQRGRKKARGKRTKERRCRKSPLGCSCCSTRSLPPWPPSTAVQNLGRNSSSKQRAAPAQMPNRKVGGQGEARKRRRSEARAGEKLGRKEGGIAHDLRFCKTDDTGPAQRLTPLICLLT